MAVALARDPAVEARVVRHHRALEGGDRLGHGLFGDRLARIGARELLAVAGHRLQHRQRAAEVGLHLFGRLHRAERLVFERLLAAVPHELRVVGGVHHRRRGAAEHGAVDAHAGAQAVGPAQRRVVAGGARQRAVARQARIEEQRTAEFHAGRRAHVVFRLRHRAEQPLLVLCGGLGRVVHGRHAHCGTRRQREHTHAHARHQAQLIDQGHGTPPPTTTISVRAAWHARAGAAPPQAARAVHRQCGGRP